MASSCFKSSGLMLGLVASDLPEPPAHVPQAGKAVAGFAAWPEVGEAVVSADMERAHGFREAPASAPRSWDVAFPGGPD